MQISIELTSIQLVFQIVLYPSKTAIIIFMYFHTAHPQTLPRYAKNSEHSLDTTAQSEDAALPRQSTFYSASSPYMYTKVKHSLCRNFTQQGFCSYGKRCQFAHGLQELRHNTSGNPSYKTRSCLAFIRDGFCLYGTRCNFIHESPRVEGEGKWRQIYANFREEKDMFRKDKQSGPRLMRMLESSER